MLNYKIFQICFERDQFNDVIYPLVPFDNTENEFPELREFHCFRKAVGWPSINWQDNECVVSGLDAWGFFGPRWGQKLKYSGEEINRSISENTSHDVWIFNHARIVNSLTLNVWEHGEIFHPGISSVARALLKIRGYDPAVVDSLMTEANTCYCSYFVARRHFWKNYLQFLVELCEATYELPANERAIFLNGANYARDRSLNLFPFIVERMFSTFLCLKSTQYKVYSRTSDFNVYGEGIAGLADVFQSLNKLKMIAISHNSNDLLDIWNKTRLYILKANSNILNLD
jgi:hypothetical protein